ncbi:MAG: serine hydrolase domain-containing protein, partial [Gammaproteobacteria bacterium]
MDSTTVPGMQIHGRVAPGFERVREAFAANFERDDAYREAGAALAVYRGGECVVDLWGGVADRAGTRPWMRETLINVYSTTKGLVAALVAMLVDDGVLDYDAPLVRWWPEFGAAGKEATTLAHLLSHQAGLTGFQEHAAVEDLYDWDAACARLARQAPCWPPGTVSSYHAMTWGFLVGEVIRRAVGAGVGALCGERLRAALGADVFIGLPHDAQAR